MQTVYDDLFGMNYPYQIIKRSKIIEANETKIGKEKHSKSKRIRYLLLMKKTNEWRKNSNKKKMDESLSIKKEIF